jgi:hypothetical protein
MKRLGLIALALTTLLFAGCDGNASTDNGQVRVSNHTDLMVSVIYDQEVDTWEGVGIIERETLVPPHETRTIYVDSLWWDGEVLVCYDGFYKVYDLDFGVDGVDSAHVYASHFDAIPVGDG